MSESSTDDELNKNPGQDVNNNETGASSEASSTDTQGAAAAESPPAEKKDDNKPKDLVSAVRAALDKGKEQSSGSSEEGEEANNSADPDKAKAKEGEEEELGELTEEELNSYKPKTRRRMQQLLQKQEELTAQVEQFKPAAEQFQGIREFCEKARLDKEDVNTGFEIMNLMKNKPAEAYARLMPIFETLKALVGEVLPEDLQKQVMDGKITEDHARELSRLRSQTNLSKVQSEQEEEDNQVRGKQQALEALKDECATAVTGWEKAWQKSDPDFRVKHTRVMNEIKLALYEAAKQGTLPKNKTEAVALAEKVKKEVEADMKKLLPKKASVTPITRVNAATQSTPAPKTMLDAVKQAVGQA